MEGGEGGIDQSFNTHSRRSPGHHEITASKRHCLYIMDVVSVNAIVPSYTIASPYIPFVKPPFNYRHLTLCA